MANEKRPTGPNVKRLICHRTAQLMVPGNGSLGATLKSLATPGKLQSVAREATSWVFEAIDLVKQAPDSPWSDDEEIAAEILSRIDERKKARRQS